MTGSIFDIKTFLILIQKLPLNWILKSLEILSISAFYVISRVAEVFATGKDAEVNRLVPEL